MFSRCGVGITYGLTVLVSLLQPSPGYAHARWFIDDTHVNLHPEYKFDQLYFAMLAGAATVLLVALVLEIFGRRLPAIDGLLGCKLPVSTLALWRLLAITFGCTLIINSMTQVFLAPNLSADASPMLRGLMFLQILIGAMFIVQARLTLAGLAVLLLPIACAYHYSLYHAIDYAFELAGLGVSLMLIAPALAAEDMVLQKSAAQYTPTSFSIQIRTGKRNLDLSWLVANPETYGRIDAKDLALREAQASSVLRIMLGLQLIVLAVHDKLMEPGVSLAFVEQYPFVNIAALAGLTSFSNLHFVFGAGLVEIVLGLLLLANIAVRPAALVLLFIFTTSGVVFGIEEMVGHVPIIAMLLVIVATGAVRKPAAQMVRRWQLASMTGGAAAIVGLIGLAGTTSLAAPARVAQASLAQIVATTTIVPQTIAARPDPAAVVPAALYLHYAQIADPNRNDGHPDLAAAEADVRAILDGAQIGKPINKDWLAVTLLNLSSRHEAIYGRDQASFWLHYAHLTTSCSHDDVLAFRALIESRAWSDVVVKSGGPLQEALMMVAKNEAETILQHSADVHDPALWPKLSAQAPMSGPNYIHTHNLAAIARIVLAAAKDVNSPTP